MSDGAMPPRRGTRPSRRSRGTPRSFTVTAKHTGPRARELLGIRDTATNIEITANDVERPRTREDCRDAPRPCPWVACKHHLYLDINGDTGSIKLNFPDLEPWELQHTCALDVAERGGITLEEVGEITNLTRERIRQIEVRALLKLKVGTLKESA